MRLQSVFHWDYTEKVDENAFLETPAKYGVLTKQMCTVSRAAVCSQINQS